MKEKEVDLFIDVVGPKPSSGSAISASWQQWWGSPGLIDVGDNVGGLHRGFIIVQQDGHFFIYRVGGKQQLTLASK